MNKLETLSATARPKVGKEANQKVRQNGELPAVIYGGGGDPASVKLSQHEFERLILRTGEHAVLQLDVTDAPEISTPVLLKDVQHHPVKGQPIHVDFLRISLDKPIVMVVPIVLTGRAKGVIAGGIVDHQLRYVELEVLPLEVPDQLVLDISELELNGSMHVSDLPTPEGARIVTDGTRTVAAILQSRTTRLAEQQAKKEAAGA